MTRMQHHDPFEFVPEDADTPMSKPEWRVFRLFGVSKFDEATQNLQFIQLKDGLYHYRDRRNAQVYSVPEISVVEEYFAKKKAVEQRADSLRGHLKRAFLIYAAVVVSLFFLGWFTWDVIHAYSVAEVMINTTIYTFLFGPLVIGVGWVIIRGRIPELPFHKMFLTQAELEQQLREQRRREAMAAAMAAAYVVHKVNEHNRHLLAEDIVNEQERRRAHGGW